MTRSVGIHKDGEVHQDDEVNTHMLRSQRMARSVGINEEGEVCRATKMMRYDRVRKSTRTTTSIGQGWRGQRGPWSHTDAEVRWATKSAQNKKEDEIRTRVTIAAQPVLTYGRSGGSRTDRPQARMCKCGGSVAV